MHDAAAGGGVLRRATESDSVTWGMTYLKAHELSPPSERYVYIFWILLVCLGLLLGLEHFVGLTDRTIVGAIWSKWSASYLITRFLRTPRVAAPSGAAPQVKSIFRRALYFLQRHAFLSLDLGRITAMVLILLPVLCLTFAGFDYIDPRRSVFEMDTSTKTQPQTRSVHWGIGHNTPVMLQAPSGTLSYHTWWTIGSRAGDMANALTPLVVLFALKQVPFALLALPIFGGYSMDALIFLHKWGGCLLWIYATVHTITWLVQVSNDKAREPEIWSRMLTVPRFRWAIVAYLFLTILVFMSATPIRRRCYEVFYFTHVVCIFGFTIATWAHHPQLGWWMLAALLLWLLERLTRIVRVMWINYSEKPAMLRDIKHASVPTALDTPYGPLSTPTWAGHNKRDTGANMPRGAKDAAHPAASASELAQPARPYTSLSSVSSMSHLDVDQSSKLDLLNHPSSTLDLCADVSHPVLHPLAEDSMPPTTLRKSTSFVSIPSHDASGPPTPHDEDFLRFERAAQTLLAAPFRPVVSHDLRMQLYPGYAFIQPLAGHMLRLVLRTAAPLRWRPGQWVYLQLPHLSWFQSHPFTIASSFTKPKNDRFGAKTSSDDVDQLVMLLIRVRGGLTRRLWDHVQSKCRAPSDAQNTLAPPATFPVLGQGSAPSQVQGVYMRAIVDGPFGSSNRIDWGAYTSAVIVCGGSGVSFGISILDYLCRQIARKLHNEKVRGMYGRPFHLRRVCFVWIMREFAHLQWAASAIRLCLEMLPPENLNVQIYATHVHEKQVVDMGPLHLDDPGAVQHAPTGVPRAGGTPTPGVPMASHIPPDTFNAAAQVTQDNDLDGLAIDTGELTQFDQEGEEPLTAMDRSMNDYIMREGKIRRAKTRKRSLWHKRRTDPSPPPMPEAAGYAAQHADLQARRDMGTPIRQIAVPGPMAAAMGQPIRSSLTSLPVSTPGTTPLGDGAWCNGPISPMHLDTPPVSMAGTDYFSLRPVREHAAQSPKPSYPPRPLSDTHTVSVPPDEPLANLEASEIADFNVVAELTRAGYPKLDAIIAQEMERADGRTLTACCGPAGLLALVRTIVAKQVNVYQVWQGDLRGHANVYVESYDS